MKTVHVAIIATVTAVAAVYLLTRAARAAGSAAVEAAGTIGHAVNPLNNENIFYTGVNAVGASIAGVPSDSWSLGSWLYDITHPNEKI